MLHKAKRSVASAICHSHSIIKNFEQNMGKDQYPDEEVLSAQLIQALTEGLRVEHDDISIDTRLFVLDKRKEEPIVGADVLIINAFDSPKLKISHGMLAQAKIIKNGYSIGSCEEMKRLQDQCQDMLKHTHAAYVWLYDGPQSIHVITGRIRKKMARPHFRSLRASLVINLQNNYPDEIYTIPLRTNLFRFLMGSIGDSGINLQEQSRLMKIIVDLGIKYIMLVHSVSGPEPDLTMSSKESPRDDSWRKTSLEEMTKKLGSSLTGEGFTYTKHPEDDPSLSTEYDTPFS